MLVERRHFQGLVREIITEQYGLGLRNDVLNASGRHQRGWRGIGMREDELLRLGLAKNYASEGPFGPFCSLWDPLN